MTILHRHKEKPHTRQILLSFFSPLVKQVSLLHNCSFSLKKRKLFINFKAIFNNFFISAHWLTIGSYVSVRSSRYEARRKFGEHERCATLASWVLFKLPKCFVSRWTHSWHMNQLFYNIFNQMEKFFSRVIFFIDVMSVHNRNMKHARAIEFDYINLSAML